MLFFELFAELYWMKMVYLFVIYVFNGNNILYFICTLCTYCIMYLLLWWRKFCLKILSSSLFLSRDQKYNSRVYFGWKMPKTVVIPDELFMMFRNTKIFMIYFDNNNNKFFMKRKKRQHASVSRQHLYVCIVFYRNKSANNISIWRKIKMKKSCNCVKAKINLFFSI